jgi:mannose-6-phosphate isomerase-like protein (cupin superfamily)
MLTILEASDLIQRPSRTIRFEGGDLDAAVSFFVVDMDPDKGPDLHRHPYAEVFIPLSGMGLFSTGDDEVEAGAGKVVVVGPDSPHGFKTIGPDRLHMVCIHANGSMITDWLDGKGYL